MSGDAGRSFIGWAAENVKHLDKDVNVGGASKAWYRECGPVVFLLALSIFGVASPIAWFQLYAADDFKDMLKPEAELVALGYWSLLLIPVMWAGLWLLLPPIIRKSALPYLLAVLVGCMDCMDIRIVEGRTKEYLKSVFVRLVSFIVAVAWCRLFDSVSLIVQAMSDADSKVLDRDCVKLWRNMMHTPSVCESLKEDADATYCWGDVDQDVRSDFSHILLKKAWPFVMAWSRISATLVFLTSVLTESSAYTILTGLLLFGGTIALPSLKLMDQIAVVFRMWMHKPFHPGEIITLGPGKRGIVTGFVEHVSLTYLVIRDFDTFQVWIPMQDLNGLTIKNWSRRSWKVVNLELEFSSRCSPPAVEELAKFAKDWINRSPKVLQTGYIKCCITHCRGAYGMTTIFAPATAADRDAVREEFLLTLGTAAQRLGVAIVGATNAHLNFPQGRDFPSFHRTSEQSVPLEDAGWLVLPLPCLSDLLPVEETESESEGSRQRRRPGREDTEILSETEIIFDREYSRQPQEDTELIAAEVMSRQA